MTNLTNIAGVPPPNFGAIGFKVAYSGVASPAASALLKEMNAGLKKTLALEATGSIAGGIVVGGATAAAIAAGFGAIFPYATGSASLIAAGATAGTIGAASAGTVGFLMAGPVMVATLVATGIAAIVLMVKASQLSSKLSAAVQRAQNESIDLPALLTTETGREEAWGNFLLATADTQWTPRTYNCAHVDVSRHLLALPAPAQPNQWLFQHTRRGANSSHTAEIMEYISRDGSAWTAKIVDGQFLHAPNGDFSQAHHADILNYLTWDGTNWTAQLSNGAFMHAPNGDFSRAHRDRILNYKTWDGGDWTTALVAAPQAPKNWRFQHTKRGTGSSHTAEIMNYINGDGSHWTAKMVDGQFLHAPGGDFTRAHRDDILIYRSWDGSSWTVKMVNGSFLHAPNGDFNQAHRASYLPYQDWDGSEWVASLVEEGNL